jgi:hypothetical protein
MGDLELLLRDSIYSVSIATLVGPFILQASCALYNLLAGVWGKPANRTGTVAPETNIIGPPNSDLAPANDGADHARAGALPGVPTPRIERAIFIMFLTTLVETAGWFIILRLSRLMGQVAGHGAYESLRPLLVSFPLGILVLAGLNAVLLPTSFGKGLLVALLFLFLFLLVAILFVFVLIAVDFGLSLV